MSKIYRLNRRMFLSEVGRKTLAVAILGGGIAACGSDGNGDSGASDTTAADSEPTSTPEPEPEATAAPEPEAEQEEAAAEEARTEEGGDAAAELQWAQVSLGFVSAYVLVRGNEAAVVDTGTPGSEPMILDALGTLGVGWAEVDHVMLTHFHPDHIGSVGAVLGAAESATAYAGEADIAAIESPRPLQPVGDGDEIFGLQVIATPGHTPGHISVFDAESGLLVAGDALNTADGMVLAANPDFTPDMATADESAKKLAQLMVDTVAVGHGDPIEGAGDQLTALAASL